MTLYKRAYGKRREGDDELPTENHSGFWMSRDGFEAPIDLVEEGGAEPGFLKVVVLRRIVQLMGRDLES
jgi:hypothetical protein